MPAYNFKARFAKKVQSGEKLHTIRALRKDGHRPRIGQPMHAYNGLRTKKTMLLLRSTVSKVDRISINVDGSIVVEGRGKLTVDEAHELAMADGFTSANELYEFFKETHGLPFEGDLIHWRFPSDGDGGGSR